MTITTAESCTGGLIAATMVNVSGASDVLNEGYITYSNEAKKRLVDVSPETLELMEQSVSRLQGRWQKELLRRLMRMWLSALPESQDLAEELQINRWVWSISAVL